MNQQSPAIIIKLKPRQAYKLVVDRNGNRIRGLYHDENGVFYERPKVAGRRTWFRLQTVAPAWPPADKIIQRAILELSDRRLKQAGAAIGNGVDLDPYKRAKALEAMNLEQLAHFYLEAGCPKRPNGTRTGQTLGEEKSRIETLLEWWRRIAADKIEPGHCHQYAQWRKNKMRSDFGARYKTLPEAERPDPPKGDRQVEKELVTLSNILWWGSQNSGATGLKENPLRHDRPRFVNAKEVRHCRDAMPESFDELNAICRMLVSDGPRTEVLAFQACAEALIGHRTSEILRLRWDAKSKDEPGFLSKTPTGRRLLWLHKSKSSKGTFPYIEIHPMLGEFLEALKAWRDRRYPKAPWFFPSYMDEGLRPVQRHALTHALGRICRAMGIEHRTSHGMRAFFATVLRSGGYPGRPDGIPDSEVAIRMGQRSGGRLMVTTYGDVPEDPLTWRLSKGNKPFWAAFQQTPAILARIVRPEEQMHQPELFDAIWVQVDLPF
jgi:integrase